MSYDQTKISKLLRLIEQNDLNMLIPEEILKDIEINYKGGLAKLIVWFENNKNSDEEKFEKLNQIIINQYTLV